MSAKEISGFGTIEEFFFRQNYIVQVGGAAIILASNLLWVVVALSNGDPYHRLRSHAGFFMYAMILLSIVMIVVQVWAMRLLRTNSCGTACQKQRKCKAMQLFVLFYNIMLICSVCSIAIANDDYIAATTRTEPGMTIALSAVLLFVIAFSPAASVTHGMILGVLCIVAVILPTLLPSGAYYAFVPEFMLRIGLIVSYPLLRMRTKDRYEKQLKINESAEALRTKDHRILEMSEEVVDLLANSVELRDVESGEHVKRVKSYSRILARCLMEKYPEYGIGANEVDLIVRASALHDLGKINIPDSILLKPAKLDGDEFDIMKTHCLKGYQILQTAPRSWDPEFLKYCSDIALCHHEKWDGNGYPRGLKGDEIPISAQIVSVADCYDALTTKRHYKPAYPLEVSLRMIMDGECGAFSDKLMDCLNDCRSSFEAVAKSIVK